MSSFGGSAKTTGQTNVNSGFSSSRGQMNGKSSRVTGIRARLGKPFANNNSDNNVQQKSLESIYKQALSSGKLNMSNRNMTSAPLQEFLSVASSGVEGVNFWEVIDLKHIDLSHNNIKQFLPEDVLSNFRSLETLNVQSNLFTMASFPFQSLLTLECLRSLNVSNCRLQGPLPPSLGYCVSLVEINASQNQISNIDCVSTMESLLVCNFSNNLIGPTMPMKLPKKLMRVDLSNNKLDEIIEGFSSLIHLEHLDVSNNKLTKLFCTFQEIRPLRTLNLRNNKLTEMPVLPKNGVLDTILFGSNQLKEINMRCILGSVDTLCVVDLSGNKLQGLPHDMGMLGNLKTLDLTNNDLKTLPSSIGWIRSLQRIMLEGNAIRSIRRNILASGAEGLKKYLRSRGRKHEKLRMELTQLDDNEVVETHRQQQRLGERKIIQSFDRMFD
jgi:Leucine-rich repeat (LRR) protein